MNARARPVWLFDLDNTLHNASHQVFGALNVAMTRYIETELGVDTAEANRLRALYWARYGATLIGLVRHHGVDAAHFLRVTHALPGLEESLHTHAHDLAALKRLKGRKLLLTNAPLDYALRVLKALKMQRCFDGVLALEHMSMFGELRPKPDRRMFRYIAAKLKLPLSRCILVEDTLVHQKAAHGLGMGTVWMQRWAARSVHGPEAGRALKRRPAYVRQRIASLTQLRP